MPDLVTHPYELLLRWDNNGQLIAAHAMSRRRLMDGTAVLMDQVLDPIELPLNHPAVLAAAAAMPQT